QPRTSTATMAKTHTPTATNPDPYNDWRWQREQRREVLIRDEKNYQRGGADSGLTTH
ncbi:hypothetical protein A2U01_0094188, partial [Trifolium medium]|nr:hypothetical protein [Trifolium medium]